MRDVCGDGRTGDGQMASPALHGVLSLRVRLVGRGMSTRRGASHGGGERYQVWGQNGNSSIVFHLY